MSAHYSHGGLALLDRYLKLDQTSRARVGECLRRYYEGPPNVELVLTCGGVCHLSPRDREIWPKASAEIEAALDEAERRMRY